MIKRDRSWITILGEFARYNANADLLIRALRKTILEIVNIRRSDSITDNFVEVLVLVIHLHFPQRWEEPGDVETLARVAETVVIISVSDKRLSSSDPCSEFI